VTPGTRYVTVGGAIASDVHGKNHHAVGSFGQHVLELTLVTADGSLRTANATSNQHTFWATIGGMGLTGVILRAKIQLHAIPSAKIMATTQRSGDLDSLMSDMSTIDADVPYSVAWVDTTTRGRRFGRGLISHGDFAKRSDIPANVDPFALGLPNSVEIPINLPAVTLNRATVAAFNELWFRKAPKRASPTLTSLADFFHPLDMVSRWNRIYGRPGFVQYQFVVPDHGSDLIAKSIRAISGTGGASFLTVLKRFGPGNDAPMSFPMEGWTLALDIPARIDGLDKVLDKLDEKVAEVGGRVYLSKDARLRPELLATMYPRLGQWQETRRELDPAGTFTSDLATRLGI
jgi:decaprenylphospho-beta-D-ribofuranose 2-oxidase